MADDHQESRRDARPGGVCEFDLPGYHYWRHRDPALRQQDFEMTFCNL
jgi:cell division FtsZ-interacting protein ZapD